MKKLKAYSLLVLSVLFYVLIFPITCLRFLYPSWYTRLVSEFDMWVYRNVLK